MNTETTPTGLSEQFDTDGYVAVRGFLDDGELTCWLTEVDRFLVEVVPGMPRGQVFREDREDLSTLKQLQQMGDHDAWFQEQLTRGLPRQLAEVLLGGPVIPKNLQYFNKPPGIGLPTPPHQDGHYFMLDPCEAVTLWLALDDVDEESGCVRYVRGSHRQGLREHARTGTLGFSQAIVDYPDEHDRADERPLPARPGDLLAHHALTIHRADGNRATTRQRRALGFIYYGERAREDAAAHRAYQQRLVREMKHEGRI